MKSANQKILPRRKPNSLTDIRQIEMRPINDLKRYEKNPRVHTDAQIAQIAKSITEFGWTNPILIGKDDVIIAGHARWDAAKLLNLAEVPTLRLSSLTAAQRKAYVMADNQLALNAGWDTELLRLELGDLKSLEFDISTIGFGEDFLADLLAERTEGLTDPDDVPEVPEEPVTHPGDLWIMGRHRLLCGDATVEVDVKRLLNGVEPHLMVTDPPYGVRYASTWRDQSGLTRAKQKAVGLVVNDDQADWTDAWALSPVAVAYVWCASMTNDILIASLERVDFERRAQIVWAKQGFVFGRGHYHWQHELCWYAVRKGNSGYWSGDRTQTTLWRIDNANLMKGGKRDDTVSGHGTQKPVECMRRPIENNSSPGQAVYDPFLGSGTTMIAAEQTGRSCLCLEISPAYVDVSVKRWQDFTGESAALDDDGRTFDVVAAERLPDKAA